MMMNFDDGIAADDDGIVRPAISQASCRRLPAFQFDYWLTGIGDNFAGNYVKIQADFLFWKVRL